MKINLTNRNTVGTVKLTTGSAPLAGAAGSQGAQGVQGAPGTPGGPQGDQGFQGRQGVQGAQGHQGVQGATGSGAQGVQGHQGVQGQQGFQGVQGAQGIPGTFAGVGAQGVQGATGAQGVQGAPGAQGAAGADSFVPGAKGDKGDTGAQGVQGAAGAKGDVGPQGIQGAQGVAGVNGAQGAVGDKGETGAQGFQGVQGSSGIAGAQGATGDKGETGAQGVQGAQGAVGSQGATGAQGVVGDKGEVGAQGLQGAQGVQGSKGDKGDDVNSIAAFNQANSAYDQANAAYLQANSAYDQANAAYDDANTRVLKAGDTMTGNLNVAATIISQNIVPNLDVTYDLGTPTKRFRDLYLSGTTLFLGNTQVSTTVDDEIAISSLTANTINLAGYNVQTWINDTTERANLKVETIGGELLSVSTSNTNNVVVANITIRQGNTTHTGVVQLSDNVNNTSITLAATANTVNVAFEQAKLARSEVFDLTGLFTDLNTFVLNALVPTVDLAANNANVGFTLGTTGVVAGTYGNASNVASVTVDSKGRITGVSNISIAPSGPAYDQANAAYEAANTKLPIAGGTITGDLIVSGNLAVLGDSTTLNVTTLSVEDNEIILNSNVTGAPSLDALITVNRGANANVALRWNETSDKWEWTDDGVTYTAFSSISGSGAQGAAGAQGAQGVQGAAGAQGEQGEQGATGAQGVQGATGAAGAQGEQGAIGAQGVQGVQGAQGIQGAQGVAGTDTVPIQVANTAVGERRTLDFRSANTSNLTISGTDDPTNNKVILIFDNPKLGGSGISAYGNTELYISDTPPGSANSNTALWWRANTGKFYIYYNDGDSVQWVSLTPSPVVNTSSNLFFSDANTAASIATANTLYQEKANRAGDTFTGNVSVLQNGTKLNVSSRLIESNNDLTINATQYKVNNITISANTGSTSTVAQTVVDILPTSEYRTVKYLIQIKSGASYQATEILLLHNGTTVYMTEYATVTTGSYLGSFGADINSGQMRLLFDPVFAVNTLNISRTKVPV